MLSVCSELCEAAFLGDVKAVRTLLQIHASDRLHSCADDSDMTPLHWSCVGGFESCLEELLAVVSKDPLTEQPSVLNARDSSGDTALHYACTLGHFAAAHALIQAGVYLCVCVCYNVYVNTCVLHRVLKRVSRVQVPIRQ
jgi:ankyrin repeat protein